MQSSLRSYDRLADRVKLHRQSTTAPILIVEGPDDEFVLRRLLDIDASNIFRAGGRSAVLMAASELDELGVARVGCVVDRDFDEEVSKWEELNSLVVYDDADLEAMLWNSPVLSEMVDRLASEQKLATLGGTERLRQVVENVLLPVSRLRRASADNGWGLDFDGRLDLAGRVKVKDLSLTTQSICDGLWQEDLGVSKAELYDAAGGYELPTCPTTSRSLMRGKDAVAVLGVALRRLIGSMTKSQAAPDRLEESLHLAASASSVEATPWRARVRTLLMI